LKSEIVTQEFLETNEQTYCRGEKINIREEEQPGLSPQGEVGLGNNGGGGRRAA